MLLHRARSPLERAVGKVEDRKHERHDTVMAVKFATAEEFVTEYAENLSVGGLFLRHGHTLAPLSVVTVQLDLPGFGKFEVKAKVAHVLDEETAKRYGREPGAGMQMVETPEGFDEALMSYLGRLGKRRDCLVLVSELAALEFLKAAGYRVEETNLSIIPTQVFGEVAVLALIVAKGGAPMYRDVIAMSPRKIPVIGCNMEEDSDALLSELDRLLQLL
jgi:hypothetical protein